MKYLISIKNKIINSNPEEIEQNNTKIVHDMVEILKNHKDMKKIEYTYFCHLAGMDTVVTIEKSL